MLVLTFQLGDERYALDVRNVVEVIPLVALRRVPRAPKHILGVFQYRGRVTPVLDLCALATGKRAQHVMSTRVIVVDLAVDGGRGQLLGVAAERVTDAVEMAAASLQPAGVKVDDAPFLGQMVATENGLVQLVKVADLLPADVQARLFPTEDERAS